MKRFRILLVFLLVLFLSALRAEAVLAPDRVPAFHLRARIVSAGGHLPGIKMFGFQFVVPGAGVKAIGDAWSDWLAFGRPQIEATLKNYPALYMNDFPVVAPVHVEGVLDPTRLEVEVRLDENGATTRHSAELFGPTLGMVLWRDAQRTPRVATMAEYNLRYWSALNTTRIPPAQRPRRFPIVDRFIGGDDDRTEWREGLQQFSRLGFTAMMLPPSLPLRDLLLACGLRRTAWAVYNPPGYAFDYDPAVTPAAIQSWAQAQARPYRDAGYAREDMALFAMSDEPGWYYPSMMKPLLDSAAGMARFQDYLKAQGLQPSDLGATAWDAVKPAGRTQAHDLPGRRRFYWTQRFFANDSESHFVRCTRALEEAFYPDMPVFTNWNFFSGRFYVPGPVANNGDKQSLDAAMGGHDWLEFGRRRGGTMLWTEDWFSDAQAYQWSFYAAKLRAAAAKSGVFFGGYVVPRASGDRRESIVQKILALVGNGGKALQYFVFGPEYDFPGNCYSENRGELPKIAEAHRMIGAAEDVLWPGRKPKAEVAILAPRSAEVWDAEQQKIASGIEDATNTNLNGSTVDYMAETADLYLALQHANIPTDIVDEDDLTPEALRNIHVLYVAEPDVPIEGQRGIREWVRAGGTLVLTGQAATGDRYHQPCPILAEASGSAEAPRDRMLLSNLDSLSTVAAGSGVRGPVTAFGARDHLSVSSALIDAAFEDHSPAVVRQTVAKGRILRYAWLPGLSYRRSAIQIWDHLPAGFSESIRAWITYPVELAGVRTPVTVSHALVETPLLLSSAGAAVTLLNWSGEKLDTLRISVRLPFRVRSVESAKHGKLKFQRTQDGITCAVPLDGADILSLRR